ncbi:MAG: PA14 domain-containing protein, partial [Bacteroidota bacterium]
ETNAFANLETLIPSAGIIPYTVNSPLWSDGASKKRWIALPNNGKHDSPAEKIVFDDDQPWQFPEGTVLIKHFELPVDANKPNLSRRLETRFIVIGKNEQHYGLTYRWRTNHKEADLVVDGVEVKVSVKDKNGNTSTQNWSIPSSSDCLTCHTDNAGKVLGVNTHQLNGNFTYPASGVSSNQLETWSHLGMFNISLADPTDYLSSVPLTAQNATTNHKIFSYLDANCGHCHHPTGVEGAFDARFHLSYDARKLINQAVDGPNSTVGGVVVKPGKPNESELFIRDNLVGGIAMPPLAKELIDEPYIAQLRNWINEQKEPAGFDRIGEAGFVMVDHSWKKVNLRKSYTKPVVIAGGVSNRGGQAAFARVRNVTPNSFEVKVEEWACMDKRHLVEQINYLVVEAGRHELTNGKILEAGILDEVNHEWTTENFSEAFSSVPVVMAQIVSNEQEGVNIRLNHSQVNANRLSLKIQNAEKGGLSKEKVGWIAVEKGSQKTGFAFESGTFRNVNSNWKHLTFSLSYTYKPLFVGFIGTYRGGDPASLRFEEDKLTGNGVKVYVQEDQCLDTEVVHTNEHINFLVFERAGFLHGKSQVSEKKDQTINFAAIPDKQVGDAAFNLTASASSGLGVTFSIESGPATVSGRKVSLTGKTGTVRIKASQAGNVNWKPAEAIRTFKVTAAPTPSDCEGTGIITLDIWKNVPGMEIADIPLNRNPSTTSTLSIFEIDPDMDDEYASRIRGYVCPPASGNYTFWIASDDHGELWLSTDDNPSNKRKIANVVGWTPYRTWDFRTGQESSTIRLEAGQKYYIEALHKEGGGGDNLSVGWQLPSGTMERPIRGNRLLPMSASSAQQGFVPLEENIQVSAQSISIYPNPANGMIYLNWEGIEASPESYYVRICDLSGKCLVEKKLAAQGAQLDVSQLAKGIYQIMVEAGEYRQVSRVLILD